MYVFAPYYRAIKYGEKSGPSPKNAARMTTLSPLSPKMGGKGGEGGENRGKAKEFSPTGPSLFPRKGYRRFSNPDRGRGGGGQTCVLCNMYL